MQNPPMFQTFTRHLFIIYFSKIIIIPKPVINILTILIGMRVEVRSEAILTWQRASGHLLPSHMYGSCRRKSRPPSSWQMRLFSFLRIPSGLSRPIQSQEYNNWNKLSKIKSGKWGIVLWVEHYWQILTCVQQANYNNTEHGHLHFIWKKLFDW